MADDFFVGYLPTPANQKRFLHTGVVFLGIVAATLALLIAARQRDPGSGSWNYGNADPFEGVLEFTPYPSLRTGTGSLLIVNEGKVGGSPSLREHAGKRVRLTGSLIRREGRAMIELSPAAADVVDDAKPTMPPPIQDRESITPRGEIIDPKCFLGAMKPGDGKPHKGCATLCLRGGIPPMFVTRSVDGATRYHLLVDEKDAALTGDALAAILPFVADDVELTGTRYRRGDLEFIEIGPDSIRRH
jgi:hypothetical protein